MSSRFVRDSFKTFLNANVAETVIDLSAEFRDMQDLMSDNSITYDDNWLGVQFTASDEQPIASPRCFREFGTVFIHIVAPVSVNVVETNILDRADNLRAALRGIRIADEIIIESVTPLNTEAGTTIEFDNGFTSGTFFINYYRDIKGV